MVKKCFYCYGEIDLNSVVDMCPKCMYQIWGEKMTRTILENMENERRRGNLSIWHEDEEKVSESKVEILDEIELEKEPEIVIEQPIFDDVENFVS